MDKISLSKVKDDQNYKLNSAPALYKIEKTKTKASVIQKDEINILNILLWT